MCEFFYDHKRKICWHPESHPFRLQTSPSCGPIGLSEVGSQLLTPGPLGHQDAADPDTLVLEASVGVGLTIDLHRGNFDDHAVAKYASKKKGGVGHVAGEQVYTLQKTLVKLGVKGAGTPDGDFGKKTEHAVREFQKLAQASYRLQSGKVVSVVVTFKGKVSGSADKSTRAELRLWMSKHYQVCVLTFPATNYRYQPARMSLSECLRTLPGQLRPGFRTKITTAITAMHKIGFAFGVWERPKAGYRTFQQQHTIDPSKTKAGPGESFHNYGCAVDLGVLQWVDEEGKVYEKDFWLGRMDAIGKYKGFSAKIWAKRNSVCPNGVHALSWETIHLQGVPANTSGRSVLVKCLNKAAQDTGDTDWQYRVGSGKNYDCNLGDNQKWTNVGTAKNMWKTAAKGCTTEQRKKVRTHMEKAESIALTIAL